MAAGLFGRMLREARNERVEVRSAGTMTGGGSPASEGAVAACAEVEVDLGKHRSTALTSDSIHWADIVLCMEYYHSSVILESVPGASTKTHLLGEFGPPEDSLEVWDPVGQPLSKYRLCRDRLFDCLRGLLDYLPRLESRRETIVLSSDMSGLPLKREILAHLKSRSKDVLDCGPFGEDAEDDPSAAVDVGRRVAGRLARCGILVGTSGVGMSIAANKIPGVRAALCADPDYAVLSRRIHNANVLCLGAEFMNKERGE